MTHASTAHVTDTIAGLLRGNGPHGTSALTGIDTDLLARTAREHGVVSLLFAKLAGLGPDAKPAMLRLREGAVAAAIWELTHKHVLCAALERFAQAGIQPILLKGTALAYGLYEKPLLRVRGDTDVLVRDEHRTEAERLLVESGFARRPKPSGTFVSFQDSYSLLASDSTEHVIDLHWRPINSARLSRLFSHDELLERARPLPRLSSVATSTGNVDALLIACVHRLTHVTNPYFVDDRAVDPDRLIWLYDIHLLAQSAGPEEWQAAVELAQEKGLCSILLNGLQAARAHFDTPYPQRVGDRLMTTSESESLHAHLTSGPVTQYLQTLKAMPKMADRVRFLRELIFPSGDYMRGGYDGGRHGWIPLLYARRFVRGVWGKLKDERRRRRTKPQHGLVERRMEPRS